MAKITFRTADGRLVTFNRPSGKRRNPPKKAAKKTTMKRTAKRGPAKRSKSECREVPFRGGPLIKFCRPAGSDKARKSAKGKVLYKENKLGAGRFVKGKSLKGAAISGKKNGQIITNGGKKYRVISYRTKTGKQVRFALRVRATAKR
jgi:hypothetical protein